jgi:DNA-binding PadR family transcriptional regulator
MAEDMINQFDIQMRRGVISFLVLKILQEQSCHGYKLIEEISKRTQGFWKPTSSTIYPLLRKMKNKGLIRQIKDKDPESTKKVYELTEEGVKVIDKMNQKRKERQKMMQEFLSTPSEESDEDSFREPPFFGMGAGMDKINPEKRIKEFLGDLPDVQKLTILENMKNRLLNGLEIINKNLEELKKNLNKNP